MPPFTINNTLSFFNDIVSFSKDDQKKSLHARILSHLELWLSTTILKKNQKKFQISKLSDNGKQHIFSIEEIPMPSISFKKKILLFTLKVIATILIIPRFIAELIRFELRESIQINLNNIAVLEKEEIDDDYESKIIAYITPISEQLLKKKKNTGN
ncbi:hypothetical protein CLAVI_000401 [Candidatus Clavichlamydia salmonicola]|uniref:hypothetical protein n=1 Tax=Candidatus Clavichlamydia salmonicola TaxID=469812 RepID=UPI001891A179|nr:hypothetical protein [Candidatus Clavichlamydia salmonicola]MBF5050782.1 hypothetical protein [Candidatus Clavichlamydia salmonicola]